MTMKRINAILISMIAMLQASAQTTAVSTPPADPFPPILDNPMFYFWVLFCGVLLFVIYVLGRSITVLSNALVKKDETAEAAMQAVNVKKKTAWHKLMDMLTRSVPIEQEKDVLLDHDYDGIRELDNKLPPWWVWGFYITIVFAFFYIFYYHMSGSGKLMAAEYKDEMAKAAFEKEERIRMSADLVTEENVKRLADATSVSAGADIYKKNCLACHGDKGQGMVGPNLTDAYWIHGGGIKNIFRTIVEGVPSKGMISWKSQLSPRQIQEVSSFIMTLEGTNPENPKEPQGELYTPPVDSATTAVAMADSAAAGK